MFYQDVSNSLSFFGSISVAHIRKYNDGNLLPRKAHNLGADAKISAVPGPIMAVFIKTFIKAKCLIIHSVPKVLSPVHELIEPVTAKASIEKVLFPFNQVTDRCIHSATAIMRGITRVLDPAQPIVD